jgi:putative NIF3 family GTP cyclohydrolase 1 type 2
MSLSIQSAIDTIIAAVPGAPFADTVDTVKTGDAAQPVTSVVVTFMATAEVIEKAIRLGANLIITHEPTFYNHLDTTDWLGQHAVYQAKRKLIDESGVVIWRFHDYLHSIPPDNTVMGMLESLAWEKYVSPDQPYLCAIPSMSFQELAQWVKARLGLKELRVVGDPVMACKGIAILPGFPGHEIQIGVLGQPDVDVLITGEIHEWEVSEYVRDATYLGCRKGLIVTGHAASEEAGVKRMVPWLQERLPGVTIHFVPTGPAIYTIK